MKKILVATIALAAISMTSFAQEGFGWGIKAGATGANLTKSNYSADGVDMKSKMRIGFTAGVFVDYKFCNWFGVSADVLYTSRGGKYKVTLPGGSTNVANRMNYIDIPLLAKFYVVNGLHIDLGPQFGFLMSAKAHAKANGQKINNNIKSAYNSFNFSVPVGIGYELPMGLKFDFRYNIGISKVNKKVNGVQPKGSTSDFSLMVGWRF